jgi:outer membrane lipoprotein-sorting protein
MARKGNVERASSLFAFRTSQPGRLRYLKDRMAKIVPTFFLLWFTVAVANASALSPDELKSLLDQIKEKRGATPQMQADFHEAKFIRLMNKPVTSTGNVWFQAPNKFRREVKGNSPSVTLSDGQQLWIYYPGFKSAEHYS